MNRERRKQIAAARVLIDKGKALLDEARDMLETVKDDEQAARANLPPSLEDSERAQAMDAAVSELESAISALEDFDSDETDTNPETASEYEGITKQPIRPINRQKHRPHTNTHTT